MYAVPIQRRREMGSEAEIGLYGEQSSGNRGWYELKLTAALTQEQIKSIEATCKSATGTDMSVAMYVNLETETPEEAGGLLEMLV